MDVASMSWIVTRDTMQLTDVSTSRLSYLSSNTIRHDLIAPYNQNELMATL